jgi:hypothetical protein
MFMWAWRDLRWPTVGKFFWWLAGRSIEASLFSRHKILLPKIRWWEVVISLPAVVFGAILPVGLCIGQSVRTEFPFWMLLAVFGIIWLVLGASTCWHISCSGNCEGDSHLALLSKPEF